MRPCGSVVSRLRAGDALRRAPTLVNHQSSRLNPTRSFASSSGSRDGGDRTARYALSGVAVTLAASAYMLHNSETKAVQCDGAPGLVAVDKYGRPWTPVHALETDDPRNPMRIRMATWIKELQDHIVTSLESIEASHPPHPSEPSPSSAPPKFLREHWIRPSGGGEGSSCVLSGGRVFEKAGVNISIISSKLPPAAQRAMKSDHAGLPVTEDSIPLFVAGISIVLHPRNPHVPTVHLNYRYFELENPEKPIAEGGEPLAWWFGGGSDLTPSYLDKDDARYWHKTLKSACDAHDKAYWPKFKKWCDEYFYIPHRKESRGVGGFFFDDLTTDNKIHGSRKPSRDEIFGFIKSASSAFLPGYLPIVLKHKDQPWTEEERRWQLLRRGRYVEFNLVYDRGTKFGLATPGARIESILMSLPETARWEYMSEMGKEGTPEGELMEVLREPRDWTN